MDTVGRSAGGIAASSASTSPFSLAAVSCRDGRNGAGSAGWLPRAVTSACRREQRRPSPPPPSPPPHTHTPQPPTKVRVPPRQQPKVGRSGGEAERALKACTLASTQRCLPTSAPCSAAVTQPIARVRGTREGKPARHGKVCGRRVLLAGPARGPTLLASSPAGLSWPSSSIASPPASCAAGAGTWTQPPRHGQGASKGWVPSASPQPA